MTNSPRREWKSLRWVARWSVRLRMRSVRIATCTSGEPVSPGLTAYSPMSVCLRSAVIDIGFPSTIDDAHRPKPTILDPRQGDDQPVQPRADDRALGQIVEWRIVRRHKLAVTQSSGLCCRQGEGRDVVQRRLDRQQMLGSGQTMPKGHRGIQRNRLVFAKPADGEPAQLGDMAEGSERLRQIAGEGADIGAAADDGLE